MPDPTIDPAVLVLVRHTLGRTYAFPSTQWWEAEAAAMKILEYYGQPLPPKRTGLQ